MQSDLSLSPWAKSKGGVFRASSFEGLLRGSGIISVQRVKRVGARFC